MIFFFILIKSFINFKVVFLNIDRLFELTATLVAFLVAYMLAGPIKHLLDKYLLQKNKKFKFLHFVYPLTFPIVWLVLQYIVIEVSLNFGWATYITRTIGILFAGMDCYKVYFLFNTIGRDCKTYIYFCMDFGSI